MDHVRYQGYRFKTMVNSCFNTSSRQGGRPFQDAFGFDGGPCSWPASEPNANSLEAEGIIPKADTRTDSQIIFPADSIDGLGDKIATLVDLKTLRKILVRRNFSSRF